MCIGLHTGHNTVTETATDCRARSNHNITARMALSNGTCVFEKKQKVEILLVVQLTLPREDSPFLTRNPTVILPSQCRCQNIEKNGMILRKD